MSRKIISISVPEELVPLFKDLPNRSDYIVQLVRFDLGMQDLEKIDTELAKLNDTLYSLEKHKLTLLKDKNALEARKNALMRQQSGSLNERLKLVEMFESKMATEREIVGWLQNRLDVLKACGFSDPAEGAKWVMDKLGGK